MKPVRFGHMIGLPALLLGVQVGCERQSEQQREPTRMPSDAAPRSPGPSSMQESTPMPQNPDVEPRGTVERAGNEAAVSSIAQARCDREARCNNVGAGKKFDSTSDCVTKTRSDWRDDLNTIECPRGVEEQQLTSCLTQIRSESCENPLDTLERALACRTVDLCKTT
jgi:hypothetical protein